MKHIGKRYLFGAVTMALTLVSGTAYGFSPDRYASSSRMSGGRWAKIRVADTGMQLITTAQLRNLGFTDPSKVHVFGYGGRMISETLDSSHPDDLPLQPSVATSKGIVFFGVGRTSWTSGVRGMTYARVQNPYSLYSYYFISDCAVDDDGMPVMQQGVSSVATATTFTEHLIHEQELQSAYISGRDIFGEDFRSQTSQNFSFSLPGHVGDEVRANVNFGTSTTSASSYINVTADGAAIPGSTQDQIAALTSSVAYNSISTVKNIPTSADKLTLGIKYTPGGAVTMARLDYITVEYQRALSLSGLSELHFYDVTTAPRTYMLTGCTESTRIWDVSNPAAPALVEATRDGNQLTFTSSSTGYREYVAFEAEKVSRSVSPAGSVSNQDIHAMETPDMVIISPEQYLEQARRIASLHEDTDRWRVHVLTPEALYNEFSSGTPDVSAFRKALKMWYDRGESADGHRLSHCLILSRPTYDNLGVSSAVKGLSYPRVPIWQDNTSRRSYTEYSFGMDDFITMLADNAGTSDAELRRAELSIAVGRMPVKSVTELTQMVDKLDNYVRKPDYGSWRNRGVILSDDVDRAQHMRQAEDTLYKQLRLKGNGAAFQYERIYLDAYERQSSGRGYAYPEAKTKLFQMLNDGVGLWAYIGHGSPRGLTAEDMFNWTDITTLSNSHPFIMYAATCEFLRWDDDDISGAEILWLYPEAGSIAMMIATRSVLIDQNGKLSYRVGQHLYERDSDGRGLTIGEILRRAKNDRSADSDDNRLRFAVMGDPALRIPSPTYNVVVDEINGVSVAQGEFPEFGAGDRMQVKGHIEDQSGVLTEAFNGELELALFDAERVVETKGYDDTPILQLNMRTSQLGKVRENVVNGEWSTTLIVPSIIDNNYSPALLNSYAWSSANGMEANGAFEDFYIYGEGSQEGSDDTKGPDISLLALNSENFQPGDVVNESPVVLARFSDESGISVYGGVIGQQIALSVDGKNCSGVSDYYTPALGDPCAGSLLFPLESVEPGEHELTLTVFDNAGNFSEKTIPFRVGVGRSPGITDITTDVNPATTSVKFILSHDRPAEALDCTIEVFDLSGRKVWSYSSSTGTGNYDATMQIGWDLCDGSGVRVPRGIYLYRATITCKDGMSTSKTRKLAVTAQ